MDNPFENTPAYTPPAEKPAEPAFSIPQTVFAWLMLLFGYLFCRAMPVLSNPLGSFLWIAGLYICAFVILKCQKVRIAFSAVLLCIFSVILSASLILTEGEMPAALAFLFALLSWGYFLYAAHGNTLKGIFSDYVIADYCKANLVMPWYSLKGFFAAVSGKHTKAMNRFLLKCLIGVLIAVFPTALVLGFLSYDQGFQDILEKIFGKEWDIGSHIGSLILAFPIAIYSFALYCSSAQNKLQDKFSAESCAFTARRLRLLPQSTAVVAVLPILFLYVVFFVSQWKYYVSGFTGVLPESFSYAQYAREGFFQLCSVSVINLVVILAIVGLMRRSDGKKPVVLKILTVVFCLFTLVLISTAMAKLIMYIDIYGLTRKRVYAAWLMAVIGIVYIVIALGQFLPKMKTTAVSATVCVVLFAALALCNVNGIIANYNVQRYMDGSLDSMDVSAMEDLGDSAIPALVELMNDAKKTGNQNRYPQELTERIENTLQKTAEKYRKDDSSFFTFTLPKYQARNALESYGFSLEKPQE